MVPMGMALPLAATDLPGPGPFLPYRCTEPAWRHGLAGEVKVSRWIWGLPDTGGFYLGVHFSTLTLTTSVHFELCLGFCK